MARRQEPVAQTARRRCSICGNPDLFDLIERKLAEGFAPFRLEAFMRTEPVRAAGFLPIKQETISKHMRDCTARREPTKDRSRLPRAISPAIYDMAQRSISVTEPLQSHPDDLAVMVRKRAAERLREGDIEPSLRDGLKAQELLDRRAEKSKDRELGITIARLLAGVQAPRDVLPDVRTVGVEVIEGEAVEVS